MRIIYLSVLSLLLCSCATFMDQKVDVKIEDTYRLGFYIQLLEGGEPVKGNENVRLEINGSNYQLKPKGDLYDVSYIDLKLITDRSYTMVNSLVVVEWKYKRIDITQEFNSRYNQLIDEVRKNDRAIRDTQLQKENEMLSSKYKMPRCLDQNYLAGIYQTNKFEKNCIYKMDDFNYFDILSTMKGAVAASLNQALRNGDLKRVVFTSKNKFAEGDKIMGKLIQYIGIQSYSNMYGGEVNLHTFKILNDD
ncbi:MAG: hypothetical protein K2Q18_06130 [Bdellovibrionales bacterium]|nr:hypothetical protein [Bdellovibrionales bacterium]